MIRKRDAEEIKDLSLHPVRGRPDARHRFDAHLFTGRHFQTYTLVGVNRVKIIDHLKRRFRKVREMHAGNIREKIERRLRIILQKIADLYDAPSLDANEVRRR